MLVSPALRKNFFVVIGVAIVVVAFLNAIAAAQLIGIALAPDERALAIPKVTQASTAPREPARRPIADPILDRNPFDHVTGSLRPTVPEPSTADPATGAASVPDDPWSAPACDGIDALVVVASKDDAWSFASLASGDGKRHLLRQGGEIGGRKVLFVGWDRVWLTGSDSVCQALVFSAKKKNAAPLPSTPPVASVAPSPGARGAKPLDPELKKGIRQMSPTEFAIDRGVVDRILENQSELMRQARIIPEQENGKTVGVRLVGIKPDSLLGVLGMQNGDRLQTINGFDMANPEKALEAYARLRTADKLTVQVNRGGKNMNLDYSIR